MTSTKTILGMSLTDRKLIERLERESAILEPAAPGFGGYYKVSIAGERIGMRVQSKVIKRLEARGYLAYRDHHYELSDAGRTAAKYARDLRTGRKK